MSTEDAAFPLGAGRPPACNAVHSTAGRCVVGADTPSSAGDTAPAYNVGCKPTLCNRRQVSPGSSPERSNKIRRRQAAVLTDLLLRAETEISSGRALDVLLAHFYRQHREFGSRDRRLFSSALFAWFRWRGWLTPSPGPTLAGACYALALDMDAAANELAVNLAPEAGIVIHPLNRAEMITLACRAEKVSSWGLKSNPPPLTDLVPPWTLDVIEKPGDMSPVEFEEKLLATFQSRPSTWVRIRSSFEGKLRASLDQAAMPAIFHARLPHAVHFPSGLVLRQQTAWKGHMEIQDIAAQAVGHVCAPTPHSRWWDVCAGAGGKTLHLADLMNETGVVLATDIRDEALDECRRRITAARIPSVRMRPWNGEDDPQPGTLWDGILLDAPCSGIGTWHRNPDARWRITADTPRKLSHIQHQLLAQVADKVKPGGCLVYATCTLTEVENNGVITDFLGSHPEFRRDPFTHPLAGIPTAGQTTIWPWDGPDCNGMFICRMIRRKSLTEERSQETEYRR